MSSAGCMYMYWPLRTFRFISVLQETHIALVFFAQGLKLLRLLPALNRCIPYIWILGLLIGALTPIHMRDYWDPEYHRCDFRCRKDFESIVVISACLFISCLATLAVLFRSARVPCSVARRNFHRAAWYPLVTLLSYTLLIVVYIDTGLIRNPSPSVWFLAGLLEMSNGGMNALMFSIQFHSIAKESTSGFDAHGGPTRQPHNRKLRDLGVALSVDFGNNEVVDIQRGSTAELATDVAQLSCEAY